MLSNTSKIYMAFFYFSLLMFIMSSGILFQLMMLLLLTIILVFLMNINLSSWWALMMFLVYISGLLILFAYFTAYSAKDEILFDLKINVLLSLSLMMEYSMFNKMKASLCLDWILNNYLMYLMLGVILFFILVVACMMCFKIKTPLRWFLH